MQRNLESVNSKIIGWGPWAVGTFARRTQQPFVWQTCPQGGFLFSVSLHSLLRTENDLLSRNLQRQDCSRFCCLLLLSFVSLSVFTPLRGAHQDQNERFACSSQCHAVLGVPKPFVLQHL